MHLPSHLWTLRHAAWAGLGAVALILAVQSIRQPHYWLTADQKGARLYRQGKYGEAAKAFSNPWWIATAQYRNGDFETAAKTFARVPGADGAYNQGNAWLMHGKYDAAMASYDRALALKPGWSEAEENKALAEARKQRLEASGKDRDKEEAGAYKPDEIVFDQKGEDKKGQPMELGAQKMSDEELRASWLRRVQTTPADFLKAKFASQAARSGKDNESPQE
ncbi:tetratricopeptide repeat protein [Verrucomicrobium sp. BvORR106]|uniref:tetratricopeptide repeat protein n=1 Tax=Verrucomicrobium sp. BvORR106 TaxID=1403819 RepID=UPI00068E062A|nr:tetratricopeptide repeat protein [Verrucomicrobium sp. BvORR106]